VQGHAADPAKSSDIVEEKTFTHEIPEPGGENLRVNLWLFRGQPPANASGCEIVICRFEFTPTTR
jgi:hypothetical protein